MIAPCGLDCGACPSFIATRDNDKEALRKVADRWTGGKPGEKLPIEFIMCQGCMNRTGRLNSYCHICRIRVCAFNKGYETCAECFSYPCETLNAFAGYYDEGKVKLDELRAANAAEFDEE